MTGVLTKRGNLNAEMDTHRGKARRQREGQVKTEVGIRMMRPQAEAHLGHRKLEEAGRLLPYRFRRGRGPVST